MWRGWGASIGVGALLCGAASCSLDLAGVDAVGDDGGAHTDATTDGLAPDGAVDSGIRDAISDNPFDVPADVGPCLGASLALCDDDAGCAPGTKCAPFIPPAWQLVTLAIATCGGAYPVPFTAVSVIDYTVPGATSCSCSGCTVSQAGYDYLTNPENSLKFPAIDPTNPYQAIDTVIKVKHDTKNLAPRFGFAYSPHGDGFFGHGKTVARGGFGMFYDSPFSNFVVNAAQATPNAVSGTLTSSDDNGLPNASSLIATITPTLLPTSSVTSVVNNMVNPLTYQFNLGVERELPGSNLIALRYVGSLGKKLYANRQFNYKDGTGKRLNTSRGVINARGNFASSDYNAAQVEFTHSFAHGLIISANYVFSKSLDNSSEIFATGGANTSYQADLGPNGFAQEWGPSAYDHRQFVSASYVWAPAGFTSAKSFANAALGVLSRHWTISGVEQFQTGSYSTFNNIGFDTNRDGSRSNDRPLLGNRKAPIATAGIDGHFVGGTSGTYYDVATAVNGDGSLNPVDPGSVHWLIPFQPKNQNLYQEIRRNSFSNPGSTTNNIALEKGFGTSYLHLDRGTFILRAEVENIGNHNDVGILDTNVADIGSGNFLNLKNARQASPPNIPSNNAAGRNIVLWAKFTF